MEDSNSEQIIILYDNDCSFCNWCRMFVERRDKNKQFVFVGIRENKADSLFENNKIEINRTHPESIAVIQDSVVSYKWRACMEVLKLLTIPWSTLGYLGNILPRFMGDFIYDAASRNRNLLYKITKC